MENLLASDANHEAACAQVAARFSSRWLHHYAASKLRSDPIFRAAGDLLRETNEPLLDVGCGVGLLPFYLRARGFVPPIIGLEIDGRKIRRARVADSLGNNSIRFVEQDVSGELPAFRGNVALLDILHYLEPVQQQALLGKLALLVAPGGMLLIRDCPRDGSPRFWMTYAGEIFAQFISWNIGSALHFPKSDSVRAPFNDDEFSCEETPMYRGGPFNNRLFIFRRRPILNA